MRVLIFAIAYMTLYGVAFANPNLTETAKNWCEHAEKSLVVRSTGNAYDCDKDRSTRCIRLNNYGCVKHSPSNPYAGTPNSQGKDGAHDRFRHAAFKSPEWSIAAKLEWFERRYKNNGLRSALALTEKYSPWCDTKGSAAIKTDPVTGNKWGRTCTDNPKVPASFSGKFCEKPSGNSPSKEQCRVCNCPSSVASSWMNGTGKEIEDSLILFTSEGRPTAMMEHILVRHTPWEIGYAPTPDLIRAGIKLFKPKYH